jgi:multicomponent Na+:H+ antiporter subunit E
MTRTITIVFRMALWCLLTADLRPVNMAIGLVVALLLPQGGRVHPLSQRQLAGALASTLRGVPQAYAEAFRMLVLPHRREQLEELPVSELEGSGRSRRSVDLLIVLDIIRIGVTPLTAIFGISRDGRRYKVHRIEPTRQAAPLPTHEP